MRDTKNIMNINFVVNKQTLKRVDANNVVANSEHYLVANFKFSSDWEGTTKKVFIQGNDNLPMILSLDEDDSVVVPSKVIKAKGFRIAVKGTLEDGGVITTDLLNVGNVSITTNDVSVQVTPTVEFDGVEAYLKFITSDSLEALKDGDSYKIEVPSTIISYSEDDDTIHIQDKSKEDITSIKLPHKERQDSFEEWAQSALKGVDDSLNTLNTNLSSEIEERKKADEGNKSYTDTVATKIADQVNEYINETDEHLEKLDDTTSTLAESINTLSKKESADVLTLSETITKAQQSIEDETEARASKDEELEAKIAEAGKIDDVQVDGVSVVTAKIANIVSEEVGSSSLSINGSDGVLNSVQVDSNTYTIPYSNYVLVNDFSTLKSDYSTFKESVVSTYLSKTDASSIYATKTEVDIKQNKLTAGDNITITDNVISATGGDVLPADPTNSGTYALTDTVSGETATHSWSETENVEIEDLNLSFINALKNYILSGKDYSEWTSGTAYSKDNIVLYDNNFYKVLNDVTSIAEPDKDITNFSLYNIDNEILGTLEDTY